MKKLYSLALLMAIAATATAQTQASQKTKLPLLDKSPMDMTYYPQDYPVLKTQDKVTEPPLARAIYSRPQKNGRTVFGELVEYGTIWRLGANEATEIEFFREVKVAGKKLAKGRYTMYAIPTATQWTIIFNKDTDTWGAFKYDEKKDVLRVSVPVQKQTEIAEAFTMEFLRNSNGTDLLIAWDDAGVRVPITK